MKTIKPINLSPSFLSKVYSKGYDYSVAEKLGLFPKTDTSSMSDGRLIHGLISERLGGEKVKIAVSPYDNYRTKAAKKWRDEQPDDTYIISEEKLEQFNALVDRVINHPKISPLLVNCQPEHTTEKKINGYNVKGIIDVLSINEEARTVIDWKFVSGTVFDSFDKKALYMNYDLQASVYDFLEEATHVYFGVIESEAPYRIKLFYCDSSFLESGSDKFNKAFMIIKQANWRYPSFDIEEVGTLMSWSNYSG